MQSTFDKIVQHLQMHNVKYVEVKHAKASTCEDSAALRGEELKIGGKTLLFKSKKGFHLFALSAAKEIDSTRVRKILRSQKLRFATKEELANLAGVEKGALPPFGHGVTPFDLYLDISLLENERIAFNAGVLTRSFILSMEDYLSVVKKHALYASFAK